jgi:hypothetical protein
MSAPKEPIYGRGKTGTINVGMHAGAGSILCLGWSWALVEPSDKSFSIS